MEQEVKVPEIAEGVTTGTVVAINVAADDQVEEGQTLLELETDKAVVELPSPATGRISDIRIEEGAEVSVGDVIMLLDTDTDTEESDKGKSDKSKSDKSKSDKSKSDKSKSDKSKSDKSKSDKSKSDEGKSDEGKSDEGKSDADAEAARRGDRVAPASPTVRRQARELGVDIHQVQGSGPGGRIDAEDVRAFVRATMERVTGGGTAGSGFSGRHAHRPLPDMSRFGASSRESLSKVREVTADAMSYSWSTVPLVTQYDRADIGAVDDFRREFNADAEPEDRLTLTAFLVKVCAAALHAFPHFNSALDPAERERVRYHFINIGVAVDTDAGLLVPVLRDVDAKGVETIAVELNRLAARARDRRLTTEEMAGGTFTISNLGGLGGGAFTPLVYPPQAAILGVARATTEPVWTGTEFEPRPLLPLCLSYDHRVADGADGARFLRWICEALENPLNLVMKE